VDVSQTGLRPYVTLSVSAARDGGWKAFFFFAFFVSFLSSVLVWTKFVRPTTGVEKSGSSITLAAGLAFLAFLFVVARPHLRIHLRQAARERKRESERKRCAARNSRAEFDKRCSSSCSCSSQILTHTAAQRTTQHTQQSVASLTATATASNSIHTSIHTSWLPATLSLSPPTTSSLSFPPDNISYRRFIRHMRF